MERHYNSAEKAFLRELSDLCTNYNIAIVSESPSYGITICGKPDECDIKANAAFNNDLSYIQRGLISDRSYVVGHKVVFRDTGRSGIITGAYWKFAEHYDYEATMDDDGSVIHFTDDDNFYTI